MKQYSEVRRSWLGLSAFTAAMITLDGYAAEGHQHGVAELNLVAQLPEVMVELVTPAANLVGFEHRPQNEQQRQRVEQAKQQLLQPAIELLGGPSCQLVSQTADWGELEQRGAHKEHDDDHHEAHHKEHDDDHHEAHHKEHDDDHHEAHHKEHDEHHHDTEDSHQDVTLSWQYRCDDGQTLSGVRVDLFDAFPAMEKLRVQWVDGQGQHTGTLQTGQRVLMIDG